MEDRFSPEVLADLDAIVEELRINGRIEKPKEEHQYLYAILAECGWLHKALYNGGCPIIGISKSTTFDSLYAGGKPSERYVRRIKQLEHSASAQTIAHYHNESNVNISGGRNKVSVKQGNTEIEKKSIWGKLIGFLASIIKCQ
jgi:hypothetical protein